MMRPVQFSNNTFELGLEGMMVKWISAGAPGFKAAAVRKIPSGRKFRLISESDDITMIAVQRLV